MRSELKYLVRETDRERLAERIAPYVRADPHAQARLQSTPGYTVRSIYYDTPGLRDWAEKESGDLIRRKVRVRAYDAPESGPVFLELKRKEGSKVWKHRAALPASTAGRLLAGAPATLAPAKAREAAGRFLYRLRAEHRRPVLLVAYDREPHVGRFDPSLRVTFDRRLRVAPFPAATLDRSGLFSERLRPLLEGHFILEVKFDRAFPSWMRAHLAALGLGQQALSKYGMGVDAYAHAEPWRFSPSAVAALAHRPAGAPHAPHPPAHAV